MCASEFELTAPPIAHYDYCYFIHLIRNDSFARFFAVNANGMKFECAACVYEFARLLRIKFFVIFIYKIRFKVVRLLSSIRLRRLSILYWIYRQFFLFIHSIVRYSLNASHVVDQFIATTQEKININLYFACKSWTDLKCREFVEADKWHRRVVQHTHSIDEPSKVNFINSFLFNLNNMSHSQFWRDTRCFSNAWRLAKQSRLEANRKKKQSVEWTGWGNSSQRIMNQLK